LEIGLQLLTQLLGLLLSNRMICDTFQTEGNEQDAKDKVGSLFKSRYK